jgi:hypothetical protein
MPPLDQLLVDFLDAAGYRIEPHLFGLLWVATHLDTGRQVAGEDPTEVARTSLRRLRQEYAAAAVWERRYAEIMQAISQAARTHYQGEHGLTSAAHSGDPLALVLLDSGLV